MLNYPTLTEAACLPFLAWLKYRSAMRRLEDPPAECRLRSVADVISLVLLGPGLILCYILVSPSFLMDYWYYRRLETKAR